MAINDIIANKIKKEYLCGQYEIGARLPTVREFAELFSISTLTVGKAIEKLASEGVVSKQQGSGIYVQRIGNEQGLTSVLPKIGCIIQDFRCSLAHRVMEGVERVANDNNYMLVVANSKGDVQQERNQLESMFKRGVRGVVLYPTQLHSSDHSYLADEFRDSHIVTVDMYRPVMHRSRVVFDNFNAGQEITKYLLGCGAKRPVFLRFKMSYPSVDERYAGHLRTMKENKIEVLPSEKTSFLNAYFPGSADSLNQLLDSLFNGSASHPDVLIMPSDDYVPYAMNRLNTMGLSVPEEVVVAGFDNYLNPNSRMSNFYNYWPSVEMDFARLGERAATLLLEKIANNEFTETEVILPCRLVIPEGFKRKQYSKYNIVALPVPMVNGVGERVSG